VTMTTSTAFRYELEEVWLPVSENILAWEHDFHQLMLDDQIRMVAYKNAIQEAVKPGMVVLDLGTGTGILGLWALQAGAKHLYAIDVNAAVIPEAIATFERGGFSGKYQIFHGLSYDINLPSQVDLIISEIIGNLGDNEDFIPILSDARKRFLKQDGRMLPRSVRSQLVPVSAVMAHRQVAAQKCRALNTNYSLPELMQRLAVKSAFNLYYDAIIPRRCYLSDQPVYTTELAYVVTVDGVLTGFKGSFIAELSDSVVLDISGDDIAARTTSDSWKHCYLPLRDPLNVKQGDEIRLRFARSYPSLRDSAFRQCYRWSGNVTRHGEVMGAFDQSTGNIE
jgi:2-polyprenyl-3-methyl-5-hydroxy-6-metoxy-1,4-benzoquinol methylase